MWILLILIAIITLTIFFWQISNLISVILGSLYVKTDRKVIRQALKLAKLKKGDVFFDLGSGNGDVLIEAAKMGTKATGYEISPYYYIVSKIRIYIQNLFNINRSSVKSHINVRYKNIFNVDLTKTDVVYCYLLPKMLEKLSPKFKEEIKKGSRLISIGFPIKNMRGFKHLINNRKIYIYYL